MRNSVNNAEFTANKSTIDDNSFHNTTVAIGNEEIIVDVQRHSSNDLKSFPFCLLHSFRIHWADPLFRKMLWNVFLLACSWCLGQAVFYIQLSTTTIAATNFANWYLATIPIGTMLFLGTIWSIFLPRAIARFGYRPPFYFGAVMGMIGAGLCILATWYRIYWLLIVGCGFIGGQVPCTLYYRLVAVQFSTEGFTQTTIAMVTAGGCVSVLIGPEITKYMVNVLPKPYSGSYVVALCECMLLLLTITLIQFPNVNKSSNTLVSTELSTNVENDQNRTERSILTIARQQTFLIATLGGFVSWSAMAVQMSAAPLAMTSAKYNFSQVVSAVQYHLLGMFAPSFFTGTLCNWFGSRLVMFTGLLIELTGTLLFQRGLEANHFYLGLIIIGVGWNFGYVGASVLLTKTYRSEEKTKTYSLYESLMMIGLSISFFASAFAEQLLGWTTFTGKVISIYLGVAVLILLVNTIFVFCKTKDIRSETTVND